MNRPSLVVKVLVLSFLAVNAAGRAFAFQSVKVESISAGVFIGGTPQATDILFRHAPLTRVSDITRDILILGGAGDAIPPKPPPYEFRLTPFSNFVPFDQRVLRLFVQYRFPDPGSQDPPPAPTDSSPVEGVDPIAFAFHIPSDEVTGPVLQYRIVGQRIRYQGNQLQILAEVTFPPMTQQDPDPFFSVGVQANAVQIMGVNGGRFALVDGNPEDGETAVEIPAGLLKSETVITIDQLAPDSPLVPPGLSQPVAVYRFDAAPPTRGLMQVALLYPDFEFPQGQDGIVDGTNIPEGNLSIAGWDGFEWRNLGRGGNLGANALSVFDNTLSVRVAQLNYMAVVVAAPLSPEDRRPMERIITPNGDGKNDVLNFVFGDLTDNVKVEIFDMTGQRVRTIMSSNALFWDGRNDSGQIVESGAYIYQYNVQGERVSGLVAVAK